MKFEKRFNTSRGTIDVYISEDEVHLATQRSRNEYRGYKSVSMHKRVFDLNSLLGYDNQFDFIVTEEPFVFDRLSKKGNLIYVGKKSCGEAVLSGSDKGFVLAVSPELKINGVEL